MNAPIVSNAPPATDDEAGFCRAMEAAIEANRPDLIDDATLARVLRAAVRAYAFKAEKAGQYLEPYEPGSVTPTETVMAATAIIRAADLNLWDVSMWFNRPDSKPGSPDQGGRGR